MVRPAVKLFDANNVLSNSIPEPNSGCWLWTGPASWDGYGQINFKRDGRWQAARAHRASYELFKGSPDGQQVCHRCDNPICVNPEHLFLGTQMDNMRDMAAKGRRARVGHKGEKHPGAKLTEAQAYAIRFTETGTTQEIASRYGVSWSVAKSVRSGRSWRHLCPAA